MSELSAFSDKQLLGIRFIGCYSCKLRPEHTRLTRKFSKNKYKNIMMGDTRIDQICKDLEEEGFIVFDNHSLTFRYSAFVNPSNGMSAIMFWGK